MQTKDCRKNLWFDRFVGQDTTVSKSLALGCRYYSIRMSSLWTYWLQNCRVFITSWNVEIKSLFKWIPVFVLFIDFSELHSLPRSLYNQTSSYNYLSSTTSFSKIPKVSNSIHYIIYLEPLVNNHLSYMTRTNFRAKSLTFFFYFKSPLRDHLTGNRA